MNNSDMNNTNIKSLYESAWQLYNSKEIDRAKDLFKKITKL